MDREDDNSSARGPFGRGGGSGGGTTTGALKVAAAKFKAALRDSDTGPLVIAQEVMRIEERWPEYKEEAGDIECTTWLARELGPGRDFAFFQRRAKAVEKLGESCRRKLHHEVAVWLANLKNESAQVKVAFVALISATNKQRGNCLTLSQAKPIVRKALGVKAGPRAVKSCERCARLTALLQESGIKVPD